MLVLTRYIGEQLIIGDDVFVKVLEVRGAQVRIGIEAPMNVHILRTELTGQTNTAVARTPTRPQ